MKDNKPVLVILAIFLPFLAVFFVPGLLYALDIVLDWKAVYPKIDELIK